MTQDQKIGIELAEQFCTVATYRLASQEIAYAIIKARAEGYAQGLRDSSAKVATWSALERVDWGGVVREANGSAA